jgi:tubulin-specific chaperone B
MAAFKTDKQLIRDYITANDHLQYTQLPDGVVQILLTHSNLQANHLDIRLDLHLSIADVKEKFRTHTGTHVDHQRLILKDQGRIVTEMADNSRMLGFYSVTSGMEIHVIDTDPFSLSRGGGLTDVSLVEKYRMPDEVYDKKAGTMRDFIRKKRAADPNFKLPNSVVKTPKDPNVEEELPPVSVTFNLVFLIRDICTRLYSLSL